MQGEGEFFFFPILTPPGLEEGSVGQGGQREAAGVTSPSRCSLKAAPSYQGVLLGSPSVCCGQASGAGEGNGLTFCSSLTFPSRCLCLQTCQGEKKHFQRDSPSAPAEAGK